MATRYVIVRRDSTRSTQEDALAELGEEPVLVVAGRQTEGRGRGGRSWRNAPRALAASLALRPRWPTGAWPRFPLVAGLAAREALGSGIGLKWPNDLMVGGEKVGGILVEGFPPVGARVDPLPDPPPDGADPLPDPPPFRGRGPGVVVIGLGVNLWWPDPPEGITGLFGEDPGPEAGERLAGAWAESLLDRLDRPPERWGREEYRAACATLGAEIRWEPEGRGRAVDVDAEGALVVDTPSGRRLLTSGEVREVRRV